MYLPDRRPAIVALNAPWRVRVEAVPAGGTRTEEPYTSESYLYLRVITLNPDLPADPAAGVDPLGGADMAESLASDTAIRADRGGPPRR
ncbi:hypothetical protein GCM10027614_24200 [Micromonospora vulcania]